MLLRIAVALAVLGLITGPAFVGGFFAGKNNLVATAHNFITTQHLEADYGGILYPQKYYDAAMILVVLLILFWTGRPDCP